MKVCLIDTAGIAFKRFWPTWTPLGLAYIAAALEKKGHEVLIIERDVLFRKNRLNIKRVDQLTAEKLRSFRPDLIGLSSPTELFPDAARTARISKTIFPDVPIVYGGHHASAVPLEVMEVCNDIDVVAAGEGEATMLELAEGLERENIRGISFRQGDALIKNPSRPAIENLDDLPMPARHLLDMDFYTRTSPASIRNVSIRATTMLTSRGCPFHCTFCVESLPAGKKHRAHSSSRVIAELDHLLTTYPLEGVYFLDEGFLTDVSRVRELCEIMIKDGYNQRVRWAAQVRVDALNRDLLKLMKEAGCFHLECGFETGSDRLLKNVQKGTLKQKNREIITLIKSSGIRCLAYIIVGLPGETAKEFYDTVDFISESDLDAVVFSRFNPHPGSLLYEELLEKGLIKKKFWESAGRCYEKMNFTAMPGEQAQALYKGAKKGLINRINTKDRMINASVLQTIGSLSFRGLVSMVFNSPLSIPRFIYKWAVARLRNKATKKPRSG